MSLKLKKFFFDSFGVTTLLDAATRAAFSKFGADTMTTARQSLRYTKSAVSAPGEIPSVHHRNGKASPLKSIFFSYEPDAKSVVIGPVGFEGASVTPGVLEHGGSVRRRNPRRRVRRLGWGGEIRLGPGKASKPNKDGKLVAYAVLKTAAQVDRSNRINEQLYGPMELPPKNQEPRPFMGPAARSNMDEFQRMWAGSVR